jgi:hypothetical protein
MSSSQEIVTSDQPISALRDERNLSTEFIEAARGAVEALYKLHKRDLARMLPEGAAKELREARRTNVKRIATIMGVDEKVQLNGRTGEPTMQSICAALGGILQTTKGFEPLSAIFWTGLVHSNTHLSGEKKDYWPPLKDLLGQTIDECDDPVISATLQDTLDLIEPTCLNPLTLERCQQIWLHPRYSEQLDMLLAQGAVKLTTGHEGAKEESKAHAESPALIPESLAAIPQPQDASSSLNELGMPSWSLILKLGGDADLYINPRPGQEVSIKPDGNGGVTIKLAGKK